MKVLKLSAQGLPQSWISLEQAVLHYAADEVRWESGGEIAVFHGGHNARHGAASRSLPSIASSAPRACPPSTPSTSSPA